MIRCWTCATHDRRVEATHIATPPSEDRHPEYLCYTHAVYNSMAGWSLQKIEDKKAS